MRHKVAFSISWWNHGFFRNVEIMKINGLTRFALTGGKTSCELLDSKPPHFHPHAWARPNHADSFPKHSPPTTGRVGADPQKPMIKNYLTSLALIGGKLCPDRSTATDHPSPTTYPYPATMNLYNPPRPNDPTHRGRQTLRPQNTLRESGLAGHAQRTRRHRGRQRHRQIHAPQNPGRHGRPGRRHHRHHEGRQRRLPAAGRSLAFRPHRDRKSTRLNSSH